MNIIKDASVAVTGGTGSFGNAVSRRLADEGAREIRIISRDEKKQDDMRRELNDERFKFILCDIRNGKDLCQHLRGTDFLFHAAALKQVPSCEFYPLEAVKTNILGTENVISAALAAKVKKLILLSTDKAVYPINAMGISKAMAEKVLISKARELTESDTILCVTRYGNVMGSRGSVIPLFKSQLEKGLALTITDPNMTRFMMNLSESVELVLFAIRHGEQGDIFVQKSPAATTHELATAMIELNGTEEVEIHVIGTRHGEKLYETLVSREEMARSIEYERYFRIPCDMRTLDYRPYYVIGQTEVSEYDDYTSHNTTRLAKNEIKQVLRRAGLG